MSKSPLDLTITVYDEVNQPMRKLAPMKTFSINYTKRDMATGKIFSQSVTTQDEHWWRTKASFLAYIHKTRKNHNRVTLTDNGYKELSECGTYETTVVAIEDAKT